MKPDIKPTARQWLALLVALFLLNAAITFHNVWPTAWIEPRRELSIEIPVLVLLFVLAARFARPPGRLVIRCVAGLLLLLAIGRYAEVTAQALYGRPVNLYWDAQHLPKVAAMLVEVAPAGWIAAGVFAVVAVLGLWVTVLHWALARVADGVRAEPMRRALAAGAASLVGFYVVSSLLDWPARHWFSLPVTATYGKQLAFVVRAQTGQSAKELPIEPLAPSDLERVSGRDVLLIFLESYGATTYDTPAIAAELTQSRASLAAAALATDRRIVSAFVESPTFGGGSWLAHATLMTGVKVADQGMYDLLLTQLERETLSTRFAAAGHRVVGVMPGLRMAWPEGAFYRFAALYGERELDYRGPDFGWWRIPDQYALAKLDALELTTASRSPAFVFFATINTHVPFRPTPPVQPVWDHVLSADAYAPEAVAASVAEAPEWTNLAPAYTDTFAYTFSYLAAYLHARADRDFVLILVGDHQPAASVAGLGARWDVPVHVIGARGALHRALLDAGFTPGLALAPEEAPIATMAELTTVLLRAFDGDMPLFQEIGTGCSLSARRPFVLRSSLSLFFEKVACP